MTDTRTRDDAIPYSTNTTLQERPRSRDKEVSARCIELDQDRCIVTKTQHPDVCHIVPFAWNSTDHNIRTVKALRGTIERCLDLSDDDKKEALDLMTGELNGHDKTWNVMCLSKTVHDYWRRAKWAFKWIGQESVPTSPSELPMVQVLLEFHWMPRSSEDDGGRIIDLDKEMEDVSGPTPFRESIKHLYGDQGDQACDCRVQPCDTFQHAMGTGFADPIQGQFVRTGDMYKVRRLLADAPLFRKMVEMQWAIIRMTAMSACAVDPGPTEDDQDSDAASEAGSLGDEW